MDAERFESLAAAYGGDPGRWPPEERAAALAFLAAHKATAERLLFEARQLDAALDASPAPAVSHALRDAILTAAPRPAPERPRGGGFFHDLLFGGFGRGLMVAGLGAAAVLGVAAGATVTQGVIAGVQDDALIAESGAPAIEDGETLG